MSAELKKIITNSAKQTQKLGEKLAGEILKQPPEKTATVLGLEGNLGAGKTTFLQGFAKGLGIKEKVLSPTFVILKKFKMPEPSGFKYFYHVDCYRISSHKDIARLGFKEIISDSKNIVAVEWPERIIKALPKDYLKIRFKFVDENKREITLRNF